MVLSFIERLRNARRLQQIVTIAMRFGFSHVVEQAERVPRGWLRRIRRTDETPDPEVARLAEPERLRRMIEALGPTFIKVGQILSTRRDIVPDWAAKELSLLQDSVAPLPFDTVQEVLQAELGDSLGSLFQHFDPTPLAAASLGQVHRAVLPDGSVVAVKVQRPGITSIIERDLAVLQDLASVFEKRLGAMRHLRLSPLVDELAHSLRDELVYTIEARNAERMQSNLKPADGIRVPRVHWRLTTAKVLTTEMFEGLRLNQPDSLDLEQRRTLAKRLANMSLRQILIEGFFHADPHPGNMFLLPDGSLGLVDWGMVGILSRSTRDSLDEIFLSIALQDVERLTDEIAHLGLVDDTAGLESFRRDLGRSLDRYFYLTRRDFPLAQVLQTILELSFEYQIQLPADIPMLVKVLVTTEGTCLGLDPDFQLREAFEPIVQQILGSRLDPHRLVRDATGAMRVVSRTMGDLPRQVNTILNRVEGGKLTVRTENAGLQAALQGLNGVLAQFAAAVLCAGLMIAGGLIYGDHHSIGLTALICGTIGGTMLLMRIASGQRG